jgi:DNA-binding beta-propeller fold protein YncE
MEITNQVYFLALISTVSQTTLNLLVINSVLAISICQKIDDSSITTWLPQYDSDQRIFDSPRSIMIDLLDNVYVSDTNNHKIYRFDSNGKNVTSFGSFGFNSSSLNFPSGIAVDKDRNVYVADTGNNQIKKFIVQEKPIHVLHLFPSGKP